MSDNGLKEINLICIPCPDQERAVDFYVGKLGFEKRTDTPFGGGYRWIEVYPAEGSTGIALAPPPPDYGPVQPTNTGITLSTSDIDATYAKMKELGVDVDATHARLKDAGVDVDAEVSRYGDPVPPMFWLRDHDANVLMVVQTPPA